MTDNPPPITSPGWSSRTKRIVALLCLAIIAYFVLRLTSILPIIIVSLVLSYLLHPFASAIDQNLLSGGQKPGSHRSVAILLTFAALFALFVLALLLVVPLLLDQVQEFTRRIPALVETIQQQLELVLSQPITIGNQVIVPLESIREALGTPEGGDILPLDSLNLPQNASAFIASLTGPAFGFLGGAVSAIVNIFVLLTMVFYLMKDGGSFVENIVGITPLAYKNDVRRLFYELARVWDAYLRGQIILSLVMGGLVFLAATILGVPNAPILGMLSGLLEFIPNLGPALALLPAALLALSSQSSTMPFLEGPTFAIVVIIVWTLLQNIEAVVLVPRVMGGSLNLHPIVVIVGVIAGASVAGALGVILAAPIIASARVLGQYLYGKLLDRDPFPRPDAGAVREQRRNSWGQRLARAARYLRFAVARAWESLRRWLGGREDESVVK